MMLPSDPSFRAFRQITRRKDPLPPPIPVRTLELLIHCLQHPHPPGQVSCLSIQSELYHFKATEDWADNRLRMKGFGMAHKPQTRPHPVDGVIVEDSILAAVLVALVITIVATPPGAMAVHAWWAGKLFFGMALDWWGAALGFAGIATGLMFGFGLINTFRQKNHLIIGEQCLQLVQYGEVIVQMPYDNISRLEFGEHSLLGKHVDIFLNDKDDCWTVCAGWLRPFGEDCDFQIFDWGWRMPMEELFVELESRLPNRRDAFPRASSLRSATFRPH